MKISIITPTYNSEKTLARTIESVVTQNFTDLEYIIIDGNSKDHTKDIVFEFKKKIGINFISEPDKGLYDAMNKGVRASTGDIIGILNSDDFYDHKQVLSEVVQAFANSGADAVYGDIAYFGDNPNITTRLWRAGIYKESYLDSGWSIPHPALFVKKEVYEKCGLFRTDMKLASDYEFILRILKINNIKTHYLPKTLVRMYNGGASGQNLKQRIRGWKELKMAWEINSLSIPNFFILRRIIKKIKQYIFIKD